jgi:hypothetical protein
VTRALVRSGHGLAIFFLACSPEPDGGGGTGGAAGTSTGGAAAGMGGTAGAGATSGGAGSASTGGTSSSSGGSAGSSGAGAGAPGGAGANAGAAGGSGASGSGGAGGNAAGAAGTSGGSGGVAAGAGGGAGTAGGTAGSGPTCSAGAYPICEDFEGTAAGQIPSGWMKSGSVEVVTDQAYRGTHSLRVNAAMNGARRITRSGAAVTGLGGAHWGRIHYRVQTPTPGVFVHSTLVAGAAKSPRDDIDIEVRTVDTVQNADRTHQFLYNVQPNGRAEFGKGSSYDWRFDADWHCAEWHVDSATQSYSFYFDGGEITQIRITNGAGNFTNSELPAMFSSLSFGWNNYQAASPGFVAWIDEIAVGPSRIGCAP